MRTKELALPLLFFLIMTIFIGAVTAQTLSVTITTDKSTTYDKYDPITLSGTLKNGVTFPSNALVGIEVDLPSSEGPTVLRTVQTGSGIVSGLPEQLTSAYPVNGIGGSQISTVQNGQIGYFSVSVIDQDSQTHNNMQLAITIFDGNGVPIGISVSTMSMNSGGTQTPTLGIPIPSTAHSGPAYGYADLYSNLPSSGGVPMAQEASFQFTISGGTASSGPAPTTSSASAGTYSLTFKLPKVCPDGAYHVYATSCYPNIPTSGTTVQPAQTAFNVLLIGDFDLAGVVNGNDLFLFASSYIAYYSGQSYNILCDINGDGKVTSADFFLFVSAYIQYWSP